VVGAGRDFFAVVVETIPVRDKAVESDLEFVLAVERVKCSNEVAVFVEDAERDPTTRGNRKNKLVWGRSG
jgi:hypothetical protein